MKINNIEDNKLTNKGNACFIIAEAGVNHNGSLQLAKKLIDVAKKSGADAVKFQTFKSEDLVTNDAKMAQYQQQNTGKKESQITMLKKLELSDADFVKLKKYCDQKEIMFLSTPHTESAVDFLEVLMSAFKVGSGDLTNLPIIEKMAKKQKWIIMSTGMANVKEIQEALETVRKFSKKKISLLHCTTSYPCPLDQVNLKAMITLVKKFAKKFSPLEVGYSDHTEGIIVSVAAVAMGAKVLEKHFTLDKSLPGPDHKASLDPNELEELVVRVRETEKILGSFVKKPTESENRIAKVTRKSIVANVDIPKGVTISADMLIIKRPGTGIASKHLARIMGRKAKRIIKKDALISWNMV